MKKLTIGAFAWALTSALILLGLSQAGERVMRPEFGAGLQATEAPSPAPTTGPAGEEISGDKSGRIPGASAEEEEDIRFGDAIREKGASSKKKAAKKRKKTPYFDDEEEEEIKEKEEEKTYKKLPPWLYPKNKGYDSQDNYDDNPDNDDNSHYDD